MPLILDGPYTQRVSPIQRGLATPFCQRQTGRWSPNTGWVFDQEFRGLSLAAMQALADQYKNAGIEYSITYQNGIAQMTTLDTTGAITIDVWEINASRQNLSIFSNPKIISTVTDNDLRVIARAYCSGISLAEATIALGQDDPGSTYSVPNLGTASEATRWLWGEVKNGRVTEYIEDVYSLKHTTNASNRGYYNVADDNVNCIYTQAQFYSEITNTGFWIFPAPNEIIGALDVIFANLAAPAAGFYTGALKGGSSRATAADNRVNITTEYVIGNIAGYNYNFAS